MGWRLKDLVAWIHEEFGISLDEITAQVTSAKSLREPMPFSSSIRWDGMPSTNGTSLSALPSCPYRHDPRNSTQSKASGNSCVRVGCPIGSSLRTGRSSTSVARHGTNSSNSRGKLCLSARGTGLIGSNQRRLAFESVLPSQIPRPSALVCLGCLPRDVAGHGQVWPSADELIGRVQMPDPIPGPVRSVGSLA